MADWHKNDLTKIAGADDLHISPFREDGVTYGTPTWIWSAVVENALYVRPYNGQKSRWYEAAVRQKSGRITIAGITTEVRFERVDGPIIDRIDEAYRAKYKGSALIASGQVAQISHHLNRAMDNGLTKEQASEVLTHLAFYAG